MPTFRRKPTTVQAEQFTDKAKPPRGVFWIDQAGFGGWYVTTMQERHVPVDVGEWIVAEADGRHYYTIADAEFHRIYEPVE